MERKPRILLLATGGTIASVLYEYGLAPGLKAEQLLSYIPEAREIYTVEAVQICNIDSSNMTPAHWTDMVSTVEEKYHDYDGFVICHGTDTMAYTSAALSYMIQKSLKPIVITGSQKPISEGSTDARQNLLDALLYAADPASQGVVLVFNGNVIAGTRAKKTYAHSYNAFSSVNYPPLAVIQDRRIIRFIPQQPFSEPVRFFHSMHESIVVLKLIPGTLLDVFYEQMEKWIRKGKIVVMATQVVNEGSNMEVYEVGQKVKKDFHLMEAYDMTLEATITKLMYLMAEFGNNYTAVYDGFYKTVNYDLISR